MEEVVRISSLDKRYGVEFEQRKTLRGVKKTDKIPLELIISITALIVSALGWMVTYRYTVKAQNKNFINQVINDARIQIARAIRDYQDWLMSVKFALANARVEIVIQQQHYLQEDWVRNWSLKRRELKELFFSDRRALEWGFRLGEHTILFPKTSKCGEDLLNRQHQIHEHLDSFLQKLPTGYEKPQELEQCKKVVEKTRENDMIIADQLALMGDLRNYLQNLCLSSLTGNRIPERRPKISAPVLIVDEAGNLQIVVPQNTTKNDGS